MANENSQDLLGLLAAVQPQPNIPAPAVPQQQNFFQELLGKFGQPNQFFQSAAAENPAQGGEEGLVKLFRRMQSNNPDRGNIQDFVLALMLRSAIAKSQVPQGAVQPQPNIPAPQLPTGPQGFL